jgi:hypothetical protein
VIRPEVVDYLRQNLSKHPVEDLRAQLRQEGISDLDFEDSLAEALRVPTAPQPPKQKLSPLKALKTLLFAASAISVVLGLAMLLQKPGGNATGANATGSTGESGHVGARGWVVRLPKDYAAVSQFKDSTKAVEIVHFCRNGTDPTNFLDEGLFGQLDIVRLEVSPNPFPDNPTGAASLAAAIARKTTSHGEKFTTKSISIGSLSGIQVNIVSPFPRVETYVLGHNELYFFFGGQEDDVWRDIVTSLRDPHSEN